MRASSVVLLPHTPASVATARRRLTAELAESGVPEPAVNDAAVVLSELVSNALRHARPLSCGQVEVAWKWRHDIVQIAVSDGGAVTEPRRARPALSSLGGRGLGIVETLAMRWGVHRADGTTTVWATLPAPRPAPGTRPVPPGYARRPRTVHSKGGVAGPALVPGTPRRVPPVPPGMAGVTGTAPGSTKIPVDCDYAMMRGGHRVAAGTDTPRFSEQPAARCRELR